MATLDDLRLEYKSLGIGRLLHELLEKIVWSTVREYPAAQYSPYQTWDQTACEDVLNDWIAERLWGRGDLQAMLSSATTLKQFRAALTTSLRQYLTNRRRRSVASNLYKRVRAMLRDDTAFQPVGPASLGADQRWMLTEHPYAEPSPLSRRELLEVASELSDDDLAVVRYGPFSQKLSPIIREPKLREFLVHLLSRTKGSLAIYEILDVMRLRFSLPTDELIELDEALPSLIPDPGDEAALNTTARSVVSRLELEEARLLATYFKAAGNEHEAAEECAATVQQVRQAVRCAFQMIVDCSDSLDEARAVSVAVESLLLGGGE